MGLAIIIKKKKKIIRLSSLYLCARLSELSLNKVWVILMHTLSIISKIQHEGPNTKTIPFTGYQQQQPLETIQATASMSFSIFI